jgi:hypothetical protein
MRTYGHTYIHIHAYAYTALLHTRMQPGPLRIGLGPTTETTTPKLQQLTKPLTSQTEPLASV